MECMKGKSRVTTGVWSKQTNKFNSIVGDEELSLDILGSDSNWAVQDCT